MAHTIKLRSLAHDLLFRIDRDRAYADRLLDATIRRYTLSSQDAGFLTEITLGTCRWQLWLDAQLKPFLNRPIKNTTRGVRWALRLGTYEILKMRTPSHAAVDEAVQLIRDKRQRGFVNAVLRKVAALETPHHLDDWGLRFSHPKWLIDEAREFLKDPSTVEAWLHANNQIADTFVRIRKPLDPSRLEALRLETVTGWDTSAKLQGPLEALLESEEFQSGQIVIQDLASQMVVDAIPMEGRQRIWDVCAAPGSKTLHLSDAKPQGATLVATELHPHRVTLLNETLERAHVNDVTVIEADATDAEALSASELPEDFDCILLDAPCSGLGTIQRHPELKYVAPEKSLEELQRSLFTQAYQKLSPGGILVYSLCTFRKAETDDFVTWVLKSFTDIQVSPPALLPNAPKSILSKTADGHSCIRTWSHREACDSFFWVAFERTC